MKRTSVFAIVAAAVALTMGPARAQLFPHLPGIGGGNLAVQAASKQLTPYFAANQPVIRDWSAIYPTVPALPGAAFAPATIPAKQSAVEQLVVRELKNSKTGTVRLAPGDYAIPVRVFCTDVHRHARSPEIYLLGPLRGSRADVLTRMYASASNAAVPFSSLQPLSWSLQDGMKYEELPDGQRRLYDELLPSGRSWIASSFMELLQTRWSTISSTVPGVPSFDSALGQMGGLGNAIIDLRSARDQILSNANDFDAMRAALVPGGVQAGTGNPLETPWSTPSPSVFMRLITGGAFGSVGLLEIRSMSREASIPFTSSLGYATNCQECQPLTMHALRGGKPEPALGTTVGVFAAVRP